MIVQGTGRDGAYISRVYIATDGLIKGVSNFDITLVRSMFVMNQSLVSTFIERNNEPTEPRVNLLILW